MKNKNLLVKSGLMGLTISCFGISSVWATTFNLNMNGIFSLSDQINKNIVPIHFVDNGNDFGGFIYFSKEYVSTSNSESGESGDEPVSKTREVFDVKIGDGDQKECSTQVKGLYYNAERGDRLRPLDDLTKEKGGQQEGIHEMLGGIYTDCRELGYNDALQLCETTYQCPENSEDCGDMEGDLKSCVAEVDARYPKDNAYYGMITWEMEPSYGGETFSFLLGVEYDGNTTSWITPKQPLQFTGNFINIGNPSTVVGFVYDNNGGIGFAGCEIKSSSKVAVLKELLGIQGDLESEGNVTGFVYDYDFVTKEVTLTYTGNANVDQDNLGVDCKNIGMAGDTIMKLIIEGLVGVNRETDVGVKGSQIDSKMQYFSSSDINSATLLNFAKQRSEILCRGRWVTNYSNIVRTGSVVCLSGMNVDADKSAYIKDLNKTLIVRGGSVIVKPFTGEAETGYYDIFINGGNLIIDEGSNPESVKKFVFDKQGFISDSSVGSFASAVSGSIKSNGSYDGDDVAVGSFIRGNFIIDGKVKSSDNGNNFHKLKNKYFIYGKFSSKDSVEELENVFAWRCSNGYVKGDDDNFADPDIRGYCPPSVYENAALVVIDQNYKSPLYW